MPKPEAEQEEQLNFFQKILEWFLNLFGLSMKGGAGGVPFDDDLIKAHPEKAKQIATDMAAHPMAKTLINMALKIPAVADMARQHLDSNPLIKKLTSEVIGENKELQKHLAGNKRFMEKFSDLMPPQPTLSQTPGAAKAPSASADNTIDSELADLQSYAEATGDSSLQAVMSEAKRHDLGPQTAVHTMSDLKSTEQPVTGSAVAAAAPAPAPTVTDPSSRNEVGLEEGPSTAPRNG